MPAVELPWRNFLLNHAPGPIRWQRIGLDMDPLPLDLRSCGEIRVGLQAFQACVLQFQCREDSRRTLLQGANSEIIFADSLESHARLRFGVGFNAMQSGIGQSYHMEALARSPEGERVLWQRVIAPPLNTENWKWEDVDIELGEIQGTDLVFRMRVELKSGEIPVSFPGWANPSVSGTGRAFQPSNKGHKNVVVFLIDTLCADHVSHQDYSKLTTPHIDAIAEEGWSFLQTQAVAPWTKPSVASLLTSRYPLQHGAEDYTHRLNDSERTLAYVFKQAGYRTAAIGDNGWIFLPKFNFHRDFDDFIHVIDREKGIITRSNAIIDEALDWLDQNFSRPFFLYIQTVDPHSPYEPLAVTRDRFVDSAPESALDGSIDGPLGFVTRPKSDITALDLDHLSSLYDAEIAFNDEQLGRFVSRMKALNVWNETIFVVTADHGEEFLDHGSWNHGGTLYQEQLHVPLVIKPPSSLKLPSQFVGQPTTLLDVAPTLYQLAEVVSSGSSHMGSSLLPLILDSDSSAPRLIISELNKGEKHMYAVRKGPWKYIVTLASDQKEELFHLDRDPNERDNLIDASDEAALVSFREAVAQHQKLAMIEGLLIEFHGDGSPTEIEATVTSSGSLWNYNIVEGERDEDSCVATKTQGRGGEQVRLSLRLSELDRKDAALIRVGQDDVIEISITVDGKLLETGRIVLGRDAHHPGSQPFAVDVRDKKLEGPLTSAFAGFPSGAWCCVVYLDRPKAMMSKDELDGMRALGYLGDE